MRPDTFEVVGDISDRLAECIKYESLRELVEQGVFQLEREDEIEVGAKVVNVRDVKIIDLKVKDAKVKDVKVKEEEVDDEPKSKSLREFRFMRGRKRSNDESESTPAPKKIKTEDEPEVNEVGNSFLNFNSENRLVNFRPKNAKKLES